MKKPLFSIVQIMKNEEKTLPRLSSSLQEFLKRGGEWIIVDTGSTDKSVELARKLGATVYEEGTRFIKTIDEETAKKINELFVVEGENPVVKSGDRLFDYAESRNYASSLSSNNWEWAIDCDEQATVLDIDTLNEIMSDDTLSRIEYPFVFSHHEDGTPALQFVHSKMFRHDRMKWTSVVHETLEDISGPTRGMPVGKDVVFLEHFQQPSDHRSSYLIGLAYDCYFNQDKDRQSHYMAREMMFTKRYMSAIKEFERHLGMNKWPAERAQSAIYMGDCYRYLGDFDKAEECYHKAMQIDPTRREAFYNLGSLFHEKKMWQQSSVYYAATLEIPYHGGFYASDMELYKARIHLVQSVNHYYLGNKEKAISELYKAYKESPNDDIILSNFKYLIEFPPVSIIIPTIDRDTTALIESLNNDNYYGEKEIIIEKDVSLEGCPNTLSRGISNSSHNFVVFLGDDTTVNKDWLNHAMIEYQVSFRDGIGLVALNDGMNFDDWEPKLACHWLSNKKLLPYLENKQFFWEGVKHYGCDDILTLQCQIMNRLSYAENSRINHPQMEDNTKLLAKKNYREDREITAKKLQELREKYGYT